MLYNKTADARRGADSLGKRTKHLESGFTALFLLRLISLNELLLSLRDSFDPFEIDAKPKAKNKDYRSLEEREKEEKKQIKDGGTVPNVRFC